MRLKVDPVESATNPIGPAFALVDTQFPSSSPMRSCGVPFWSWSSRAVHGDKADISDCSDTTDDSRRHCTPDRSKATDGG